MGKNNKQRRAASRKRRKSAARARPPGSSRTAGGAGPQPAVEDLLRAAMWSWSADPDGYEALQDELRDRADAAVPVLGRLLTEALDGLWRRGWTPADAIHVIARGLSAGHGDWAAGLVVDDATSRERSGQALHPRWQAQLDALAERRTEAPVRDHSWLGKGIEVLSLLGRLPRIPVTVPPPGAAAAVSFSAEGLDERMLARVRALLAKAEATEFEEEADALTAKAQELIARHAIDEVLLHSRSDIGEPSVRRMPIDDPYSDAKASLFDAVAAANRCRVLYTPQFGWVTAFGYDHDLDALELLAASLLVQATGAMARHGSSRDAYGRSRTRSFRRSFLLGFSYRVGQRLREATDAQVTATVQDHGRLLPVLAAREDRLSARVSAVFPEIVTRSSSVSHGGGWAAGQAAADRADLGTSARPVRLNAGS